MAAPHAFKYLLLAIEGKVIVELRDQNMDQQVWPCHAARDRTAWRGFLHYLFTTAAGLLDAGDLGHLHLRGDHIEKFVDIFARRTKGAHRIARLWRDAQLAATVKAAGAGIKFVTLAQSFIRD
ncbi:MAG: hypothetical protein ACJA1F_003409, partial [Paracoccaceae bacterium]